MCLVAHLLRDVRAALTAYSRSTRGRTDASTSPLCAATPVAGAERPRTVEMMNFHALLTHNEVSQPGFGILVVNGTGAFAAPVALVLSRLAQALRGRRAEPLGPDGLAPAERQGLIPSPFGHDLPCVSGAAACGGGGAGSSDGSQSSGGCCGAPLPLRCRMGRSGGLLGARLHLRRRLLGPWRMLGRHLRLRTWLVWAELRHISAARAQGCARGARAGGGRTRSAAPRTGRGVLI